MSELRLTHKYHPELWETMRYMDMQTNTKFKSTYSFEELDKKFKEEA